MSMMVSFVLSFFPRDVLDEILNLIESVSEDFPSYSFSNSTVAAVCRHCRLGDEDLLHLMSSCPAFHDICVFTI